MKLPELSELFDERDYLRTLPETPHRKEKLEVIEFLLKMRRGHFLDQSKLKKWQKDYLNKFIG